MKNQTQCPGCQIALENVEGPVHSYMTSSPACWALYGEVLSREYSDPAYMKYHQLTVDAYAIQHPGSPNRQSIQSVAVHLVSLFSVFHGGLAPREATALIKRCCDSSDFGRAITWLEPPSQPGTLNVGSVHSASCATTSSADGHAAAVTAWARDAWNAWSPHHDTVERWSRLA